MFCVIFLRQDCHEVYNVWSHLYWYSRTNKIIVRKKKHPRQWLSLECWGWGKGLTGQKHDETFRGWGNALHDFSNGTLLTKNCEWTPPTRCQHYAAQPGQPKITPETVKSPLGGKIATKWTQLPYILTDLTYIDIYICQISETIHLKSTYFNCMCILAQKKTDCKQWIPVNDVCEEVFRRF